MALTFISFPSLPTFKKLTPLKSPTKPCAVPPRIQKLAYSRSVPSRAALDTDRSRLQIFKCGVQAAVDDFVKSGLNICIGSGRNGVITALVDAIAVMYQVNALVDVAIVSTCDSTVALLQERELPSDMLVNFKTRIDLFIAPVSSMDSVCNAVLDSDNFAADKFVAEIANQVVLIILEDDLEKGESGLRSIPVQLTPFLPYLGMESLCTGAPFDFGVRGATLRSDGSNVADLSLAPGALPHCVDYELKLLPQVVATGFLPASSKATVVVATRDMQPIDMTAPVHCMVNLSEEARRTALTGDKREQMMKACTQDWSVMTEESGDSLFRKFKFSNVKQAQAFVRYVHALGNEARHTPEVKHRDAQVEVIVRSERCGGITELDALVARELSSTYKQILQNLTTSNKSR